MSRGWMALYFPNFVSGSMMMLCFLHCGGILLLRNQGHCCTVELESQLCQSCWLVEMLFVFHETLSHHTLEPPRCSLLSQSNEGRRKIPEEGVLVLCVELDERQRLRVVWQNVI